MSNDNTGAGGGTGDGGDKGAAAPAWYGDNADLKGFVENKGWQSPADALTAYRNLETFVGADKAGRGVVWPKDDADTEGWKAIHARLGVPEKPDGYKIPVPEGGNAEFATAVAPVMHQLGLSAKQAEGLAAFVNQYEAQAMAKYEAEHKAKVDAELAEFKGKMGAAYDKTVELAKRAAGTFGVTDEAFAALESTLGLKGTVELFSAIGAKLGEDKFVSDGSPAGGDLSPEAAQQRFSELSKDKNWMAKILSGDRVALEEKDRLNANMLGMSLADYRRAKSAA